MTSTASILSRLPIAKNHFVSILSYDSISTIPSLIAVILEIIGELFDDQSVQEGAFTKMSD